MQKHPLDSKRLRRVPSRFSWVDHRLIRYRLLSGVHSPGWALYLFLVTVGDEQGLSYYSDASVCGHLSLSYQGLSEARSQLLSCGLIAWQSPLYQVLCVDTSDHSSHTRSGGGVTAAAPALLETVTDKTSAPSAEEGRIQSLRLAEALSEIFKGGKKMINFSEYTEMHFLRSQDKLNVNQIAQKMSLDSKTVAKWLARERYETRRNKGRSSKLDPHKAKIRSWLEKHTYSAQQIFQRLSEGGDYHGGYTILKEYVRKIRPRPEKAYLSLSFAPGESAQVDWGHCGTVAVGNTRRNLSVFVIVLSYSRQMYIEFTLSQKQEHFLGCHQNAFEYFGGVPRSIMVDNLKSAVLEHKRGETPRWNPRYADFARDYGFEIVACNPRSPQEKGRVENGVGYVKKNFLAGRDFKDFVHIGPAARRWLDQVANQRVHRVTGQTPHALWEQEKAQLLALPLNMPAAATVVRQRATSTFRLCIDTNRYSVPAQYANHSLDVHLYAEEILIYHESQLIAQHRRDYSRHQDHENPDHPRALLAQRRNARKHKELQSFLQLGEHAEAFYQGLQQRRLNAPVHVQKILALQGAYTREQITEAISDAHQLAAHSSEYIINILGQRTRPLEEPGPLHLTRPGDLLDIELSPADLSIYDHPSALPETRKTNNNNDHHNHE